MVHIKKKSFKKYTSLTHSNKKCESDWSCVKGFMWDFKKWQPIPVFLPGKFHGQRSLEGYSPWCRKEMDTTEHACTNTRNYHQRCTEDKFSDQNYWTLSGVTLAGKMWWITQWNSRNEEWKAAIYLNGFLESCWIASWGYSEECGMEGGGVIIINNFIEVQASLTAQLVKNPTAMHETLVQFLGQEDPLKKG